MGKLSAHVLDTTAGRPAAGVGIELYAVNGVARELWASSRTDQDGRCKSLLPEKASLRIGQYEIIFAAGDYFAAQGLVLPQPRFFDRIVILFGVADAMENYHIPLLISPWAYSTYRGS